MRVLVLRPAGPARRTLARLAELGHTAIVAPVLEPTATGLPAPAGRFDAVLATSAQAFALPDPAQLTPWTALPVVCVGQRTAQAALSAGFIQVEDAAPDAATLVEALAHRAAGARYLYLAGRDRKPTLEDGLQAAGAAVTPWIVYEARAASALPEAARRALRDGGVDAALHFSRRSAEIFSALCQTADLAAPARALQHVVLSADVSAGLAPLAPTNVRVAPTPTEEGLLGAL